MGKSAPKAPDPAQTAAAQGQWNSFTAQQTQAMNMIGQNSPWGSLNYQQTGMQTIIDPNGKQIQVPQYTANTTLSPSQQAIFDQTQKTEQNLAGIANDQSKWLGEYLKGGVDTTGIPGLQSSYAGADDFSADRLRTEDALMQRLSPYQQQDADRLRTTLINQGIRPGTAAWDAEMARQSRSVDDARLGVVLGAGDEQARMVGMARDAASFNNAARGQGFSEAYAARNQPINELLGLMSGTQVQSPNNTFAAAPQVGVGGVDYTGLVNQKYQADVQNHQAKMGGLFGLGASLLKALPFSDARLKTDIRRVGTLDNGLGVYSYRMKDGGPYQIGVMAQEVADVMPDAVAIDGNGWMKVDYQKAVA